MGGNNSEQLVAGLGQATRAMRKAMMAAADAKFINTLLECLNIIVHNPESLSKAQYTAIRRHSNNISEILNPNTSNRKRKQKLQTGGFLNLVLPAIGNLISGLLKPPR